ncbi:outer kinetochore KNL1 complex subunit KNL1 [Aplochiton taeniatus]
MAVEDDGYENLVNVTQGQKRSFPEDHHEDSTEDENRKKISIDTLEELKLGSSIVQSDGNINVAGENAQSLITKTIDGSNSGNSTNFQGEMTYESMCRQSQADSQLDNSDDYTCDMRKKLEDGSITVAEFLKLFGINLFIHKSRQSILPAKLASDLEHDIKDLLIGNHINRPKQRVYEVDCQKLTEIAEGFKGRTRDQDNPLKSVNRGLWEAVTAFSNNELQSLGAKLKERASFFNKRSKVRSHEMKEVLYSNLLSTSKKRHFMDQLDVLRDQSRDLEALIAELQRINEWKIGERGDNTIVYSFLHDTLLLNVVMENPDEKDVHGQTERNISSISFQLKLDDEKSQCHARLVHKLLSEYTESGKPWVTKYPTSHYVPKVFMHAFSALLQDVGLVVGRCRLLGEEVHRMKRWGALRLDILDISCVDTRVRILFSSLQAMAKFELTIAVTYTYPFCLLRVEDFRNYIGQTTIHQVEEIVFSVAPAKNYLTKIVKSIHDTLLC